MFTLGLAVAGAAGSGAIAVGASWTGVGLVVGVAGMGLSASAAYKSWGDIIAGFREDPTEQHTAIEGVAGLAYVAGAGGNATEEGLAAVQTKTGKAEFGANLLVSGFSGVIKAGAPHAGSDYALLWKLAGAQKTLHIQL